MRTFFVTIVLLFTMSSVFAYVYPGLGLEPVTYHYAVNITKGIDTPTTYFNEFNRPGNFTVKLFANQAPTANLKKTTDYSYDVVLTHGQPDINPLSCKNGLAYCYQVVEHHQNRTTFGINYSGVSSYILPELRVRTYVCIDNWTTCVSSSTNCYCPQESVVPPPPLLRPTTGTCERNNLYFCATKYGSFTTCSGNFTECKDRYESCACGPSTSCAATKNVCVGTRNQLILCAGSLTDCAKQYHTCYCGKDMMFFQQGCKTLQHFCTKNDKPYICQGTFSACAVNFDKCTC